MLMMTLLAAAALAAPPQPQRVTGISAASVLLGLSLAGSTVADVETTVACNVSGRCQELNPILMGMASDRGGLYAVKLTVATGIWVLSEKMRRSPHKLVRGLGWALPLQMVALQSWAAQHNHGLGR